MTTVNLCKDCNFYTTSIKTIEKHCFIQHARNQYLIIHTNTNLTKEILEK